jgi:low temperature requirement protein LtrA
VPRILRKQGDPEPPTFLELFFDLVFIFVFARLSQGLADNLSLAGAVQTAMLLLAVWWIWELMVWLTDLFDPRLSQIQFLMILIMFGSLVMAVAVPTAFKDHGLVFVVAYLGIVFTRAGFLIIGTRGHPTQARSIRIAFWYSLTAWPWIAGALVPDSTVRLALWSLAITLDYLGAPLGWPTPGLGRTDREIRIFNGQHVSERHRQIFIIGLGELILSTGLRFTGAGFGIGAWAAVGVAFATAVLLFLIYSYQARELLAPPALWSIESPVPGVLTAYSHLVMVAGVVVISARGGLVVGHPSAGVRPVEVALVVGGPALFLVGSGLFQYAVTGRILWSRPIAIVLLAAIAPAIQFLPVIGIALGTSLVLVGTLIADAIGRRRRPQAGPKTSL